MPYQAVLNAAVNFEREVKRQADMADDRTTSIESLFEEPRFNLSKDRLRQLDTLRRIRNNILHGFETLVDPVEAAALVAAFDRAASWFDPANFEPVEPAKAEAETPVEDETEKPAEDEAEETSNTEAEEPVEDDTEKPVADETLKPVEPVKEETEKPHEGEPEKSKEAKKKADADPKSKVTEKTGSEKLPKI
jgi:hypothetical protein